MRVNRKIIEKNHRTYSELVCTGEDEFSIVGEIYLFNTPIKDIMGADTWKVVKVFFLRYVIYANKSKKFSNPL